MNGELLIFFAGIALGFLIRSLARSFMGIILIGIAVLVIAGIIIGKNELSLLGMLSFLGIAALKKRG